MGEVEPPSESRHKYASDLLFLKTRADLEQLHFSWALLLLADHEQLQFGLIKLRECAVRH